MLDTASTLVALESALAGHQPEQLRDEGRRRAAVALLIRPAGAEDMELLFIKRAEDPRDPWSGHMAFPGGRVDPGDATPAAAAVREVGEEIGLDLRRAGRLLGGLDEIVAVAKGKRMPLIITPFVFALEGDEADELRPNHEVEAVHWIRGEELRDPAAVGVRPYTFEGRSYELPCLHIQGRVIWGLTYQMLMRLFGLLRWPMPSRAHPPEIKE